MASEFVNSGSTSAASSCDFGLSARPPAPRLVARPSSALGDQTQTAMNHNSTARSVRCSRSIPCPAMLRLDWFVKRSLAIDYPVKRS